MATKIADLYTERLMRDLEQSVHDFMMRDPDFRAAVANKTLEFNGPIERDWQAIAKPKKMRRSAK